MDRDTEQSASHSNGQILKRSLSDHTLVSSKDAHYIGNFKNDVMIPGNEVRKRQLSM